MRDGQVDSVTWPQGQTSPSTSPGRTLPTLPKQHDLKKRRTDTVVKGRPKKRTLDGYAINSVFSLTRYCVDDVEKRYATHMFFFCSLYNAAFSVNQTI